MLQPNGGVAPDEQESNIPPVENAINVENISSGQPPVQTIMTIGGDNEPEQIGHSITHSVASTVSLAKEGAHKPEPLARVLISYPEKWKGIRPYAEGHIAKVSKESAAQFVKAGFATYVKK